MVNIGVLAIIKVVTYFQIQNQMVDGKVHLLYHTVNGAIIAPVVLAVIRNAIALNLQMSFSNVCKVNIFRQ